MIKNKKYFVPPDGGDEDFKDLFRRVAAAGAGRPVDKDGFPQGSWTPDLLAEAISQIAANRAGIELRTVQLWFQDNEKGISADNIRWLARILGCDDPEATSAWQAELSASQARLTAKRREKRERGKANVRPPPDEDPPAIAEDPALPPSEKDEHREVEEPTKGFSLARMSEGLFSRGSHLNLPASVFAGAVALQFISYFLGIHSVTYAREDGIVKQVGFLWAPNWTFLFIVFMPLYLSFVVNLLVFWKDDGRANLLAVERRVKEPKTWMQKVEASSYTYWAVFLICIGFAGVFQWISVRLLPVLSGQGDYAIDWGSLATIRPDEIAVPQQIAFTGFAYLYMSLCFYVFVTGLIILSTLADDFGEIEEAMGHQRGAETSRKVQETGLRIMRGIFRCTISGLLIAVCMKLESLYVVTSAPDIWSWLFTDMRSVLSDFGEPIDWGDYSMPTHYTSLLITLLVCVVFVYGTIRVSLNRPFYVPMAAMTTTVALLVTAYLLIGMFTGFSFLLGFAVLVGIFCLFNPGLGPRRAATEGSRDVS